MQFVCVCQVIGSIQISTQEDFTHVSILIEGNLFRKKTLRWTNKIFESYRTKSNDFHFIKRSLWSVNFPIDIYISERSLNWKH